jgi:hypothetical protein
MSKKLNRQDYFDLIKGLGVIAIVSAFIFCLTAFIVKIITQIINP